MTYQDLKLIPTHLIIDCLPAGHILYKNHNGLWELGHRGGNAAVTLYIVQEPYELFSDFILGCAELLLDDEAFVSELLITNLLNNKCTLPTINPN